MRILFSALASAALFLGGARAHGDYDHGKGYLNGLNYKSENYPHCSCIEGLESRCDTRVNGETVIDAKVVTASRVLQAYDVCKTDRCNEHSECAPAFYQLHMYTMGCKYNGDNEIHHIYQEYAKHCKACYFDPYDALTGDALAANRPADAQPTCDYRVACANYAGTELNMYWAQNMTQFANEILNTRICYNPNRGEAGFFDGITRAGAKNCSIPACSFRLSQFWGTFYGCDRELPSILFDETFWDVANFCQDDEVNTDVNFGQCTFKMMSEGSSVYTPFVADCNTEASKFAVRLAALDNVLLDSSASGVFPAFLAVLALFAFALF